MYPRLLRFMQKKHILYVNSEEGRDDFIMVGIFVYSNRCTKECPIGFYGEFCLKECNCENGGTCDPVTGNCSCVQGFVGPTCVVSGQFKLRRLYIIIKQNKIFSRRIVYVVET